jgi:hypothetical protein
VPFSDLAVITVTTRHYLHRARVTLSAAAVQLPGARLIAYISDPIEGHFNALIEPFTVVESVKLGVPRFRHLAFALDPTALCCALKPHALAHALRAGLRRVLYLDNDILLHSRPAALLAALETHELVLTPHLLAPPPPGAEPDEAVIRHYGAFNAGMLGVRAGPVAEAFLAWWGNVLSHPARLNRETGYDQSWLDFVPSYWPETKILRDPGTNVGPWNLASRPIAAATNETLLVGTVPLVAFHFSGFDETNPARVFSPGIPCNAPRSPKLVALAEDYARRLAAAGAATCKAWGYGFATFADGRPISATQRRHFAERLWEETPAEGNPFDPAFSTASSSGLRSLHRYHEPAARAARALRRARYV